VTSAQRIPKLEQGDIDIIAATLTRNPERAMQIEFSHTYFFTGQKFITQKGSVRSLKDLEKKRIGTTKGTTSETNVKRALPTSIVLTFDDLPQTFLALQKGKVQAITYDEAILAGILSKAPDKAQYEIPDVQISDEPYGFGIRKNDRKFVEFVNKTLLEMENSGEAKKIFDKWFGPKTDFNMKRNFRITADR
jgi:polar amino acid transport system substrate-binding protein